MEVRYLTLHVGLGTFQPVRVSELKDIRLHAERYTLGVETAEALNRALAEGRRVIAVGTTTTRTLEHIAAEAERANVKDVLEAKGGAEKAESKPPGLKPALNLLSSLPALKCQPIQFRPFSAASNAPVFCAPVGLEPQSRPISDAPRVSEVPFISAALSISETRRVRFTAHSGVTSIFLSPGYRFRVVDHLVTNFHLPRSTLLMLVAAFGGYERTMAAYRHAVDQRYRFYSYGDAMCVI